MAIADDAVPLNIDEENDTNALKPSRETKAKTRASLTVGTRTNLTHNHKGYDVLDEHSHHGDQESGREYIFPDSASTCDYVMHPIRHLFSAFD